MNWRRIRFLRIKIYKTINSLSPDFIKKNFEMRKNNRVIQDRYKANLNIPRKNQVMFCTSSVKPYGLKISNALPLNIKTAEDLKTFKSLVKKWNGASCNCIICRQ